MHRSVEEIYFAVRTERRAYWFGMVKRFGVGIMETTEDWYWGDD